MTFKMYRMLTITLDIKESHHCFSTTSELIRDEIEKTELKGLLSGVASFFLTEGIERCQ